MGGAHWAKAAGWAGGVAEGGRNRPSKDLGMAGLRREVSSTFSDGRSEARVETSSVGQGLGGDPRAAGSGCLSRWSRH